MPRPAGRHAVCRGKGPHGIRHHGSVPGPQKPRGSSSLTSYGSWGGRSLGAKPQLNGPEVHPRSCPHPPGGHRTGTGRGMCYSGGSPHHLRLRPGCPSPHRSAHAMRAACCCCAGRLPAPSLPPHIGCCPRPGTDPTVPAPPADHTGRASATSFPSWKARNLASAAHASFRRRRSHEPAKCPSGKSLFSPASTQPLSALAHVYSGLQNFQLPVGVIIQFPNY